MSFSLGRDRGEEVAPVDHGVGMLGSPSLLGCPRCRDRLPSASTDVAGLIRCRFQAGRTTKMTAPRQGAPAVDARGEHRRCGPSRHTLRLSARIRRLSGDCPSHLLSCPDTGLCGPVVATCEWRSRLPLASDGSTEKMGQLLGVGSDRPRPHRHRRGQQLDQIESDADRSVRPFDEVTAREGPFRNQVENEPLDLGSNRFDEIEGQVVPPWLVGMHKAKCGMEPNCLAREPRPRSQQAST